MNSDRVSWDRANWDQTKLPRAGLAPLAAILCLVILPNTPSPLQAADLTAREVSEVFHKAKMGERVDLSGKDLSFLDLAGIDFKGAVMSGANLFGVDLTNGNLRGTRLEGVMLDRAIVVRADFSGANLEGASLMRPSVNTTLGSNSQDAPKFAGANLRHIRITAMMDGADFRGADLTGARMGPHEPRADISSMPGSLLRGCDFSGATLDGADLMWAKLRFSKFIGADLTGANFEGADLDGTILRGVRGIDTVKGFERAKNAERAVLR